MNNEQYKHTKEKNCQVEYLRTETSEGYKTQIYICKTHNVEVCRCGTEWGKH